MPRLKDLFDKSPSDKYYDEDEEIFEDDLDDEDDEEIEEESLPPAVLKQLEKEYADL